jgi:hypothetical protein
MYQALVITPVKNALQNTLEACQAISESTVPLRHIVFNDFSEPETKAGLEAAAKTGHFELVHLEDHTQHPSPNYKLVLQMAQNLALEARLPLVIVESDVTVRKDTVETLLSQLSRTKDSGLIGAVTTDGSGKINYPYEKFKNVKVSSCPTQRSLSFCCTLISLEFLDAFSFKGLDDSKDWFDTFISKKALALNFVNTVVFESPVIHKPHSSRPWKLLKYSNPLSYYLQKLLKRRDKI